MTAQVEPDGRRWRAVCRTLPCPRPLNYTVDTEDHAANVARKHDRENHAAEADTDSPTTPLAQGDQETATRDYDIHAAAHAVLIEWETGGPSSVPANADRWEGTAAVWMALTGARDSSEALRLARVYAAQPTSAYVPPF